MQIVPVLDVLNGAVVQGCAGDRSRYMPIVSSLVNSTQPVKVLREMTKAAESSLAYVADLNGLMTGEAQAKVLNDLASESVDLMIDAGVRTNADLARLPRAKHVSIVLATESIQSIDELHKIVSGHRECQFVFSFDFVDDELNSPISDWNSRSLPEVARLVWQLGIKDWIVLDVRSVGMGGGPTSLHRCRQLIDLFPDVRISTGGGVRNQADLEALRACGVVNVLLATALHRKDLSKADLGAIGA